MTRYAMAIDLDKCQGCRGCMTACKVENNTVEGNFWMYVFRFEEGAYPTTEMSFLPRPCQHCDNALEHPGQGPILSGRLERS